MQPADPEAPAAQSAPADYEDLAGRLDHALLDPALDDEAVLSGCRLAMTLGVASAVVRPCDAELAVRTLEGSPVRPASVCGFPHGAATTAVKLYETRDLLRRGIVEIHLVLNLGKLLSRQFQSVEMEVLQIVQACHEAGARLKMLFPAAQLSADLKVIACKVAKRCEADFAAVGVDPAAAVFQPADLELVKRSLKDYCRLQAGSGIHGLDAALEAMRLGADGLTTVNTPAILEDWKARLAATAASPSQPDS